MQKGQELVKLKLQSNQGPDEHSLFYVANSTKQILSNSTGFQELHLQIKCSLKTVCQDQTLQKCLKKNSFQQIKVVNGKNKNMPQIKSQAGIDFQNFKNIQQNLQKYSQNSGKQVWDKERVDVVCDGTGQKFTYLVGSDSWISVKKFKIFKPMYEVISMGDHLRIAFSRKKKYKQRVLRDLKEYLSQIQSNNSKGLRFKFQVDYEIDKFYKITANKVLQTGQTQIIKLLKKEVYQNDGKLLDFLVKKIIQEHQKQLTYQVEIRFNQTAMKEFEKMKVQQIQKCLEKSIQFLNKMKKKKKQEKQIQTLIEKLSI